MVDPLSDKACYYLFCTGLNRHCSVWVHANHATALGLLLDGTLQEIIAEVSGLEDFSEAETHELFRLLMSVANEIPPIFEVKSISEVRPGQLDRLVDRYHFGQTMRCTRHDNIRNAICVRR